MIIMLHHNPIVVLLKNVQTSSWNGYFLEPLYLLNMIALNLNVRKGEIQSDPLKCFSLTTEENPPRLTIGQRWMGDLGL